MAGRKRDRKGIDHYQSGMLQVHRSAINPECDTGAVHESNPEGYLPGKNPASRGKEEKRRAGISRIPAGDNASGSGRRRCRVTRGRRPVIAIGEAKKKAAVWGFDLVIVETQKKIPFDFAIDDRGCTSLVRVRRIKSPQFRTADIERACALEAQELRTLPVPEEIYRELWVRGPGRAWHRYLVLPGSIEELLTGDEETAGGDSVNEQ